MRKNTLRIGIASYEQIKARTRAIAKGEYRPKNGEPKVWFTSVESFAGILSEKNRGLLELIAEEEPDSLATLSKLSGRAKSSLSRTLKTMAGYGLVNLKKGAGGRIMPRVDYDHITCDLPIAAMAMENEARLNAHG